MSWGGVQQKKIKEIGLHTGASRKRKSLVESAVFSLSFHTLTHLQDKEFATKTMIPPFCLSVYLSLSLSPS